MSTQSIAIIGAIATVIAGFGGAALGACFAYKTGIKLVQKTHANAILLATVNKFNEASEQFILAFQKVLTDLEYDWQRKIYDIVTPELICHKNAFAIFSRYLEDNVLRDFTIAWKDYFPTAKRGENAPEYSEKKWNDKDERKLVIKQIEKLLEFAKFKHTKPL